MADQTNVGLESDSGDTGSTRNESKKIERWRVIDFGAIPKLLKLVLVNISDKISGVITILITTIISIGDTISDLVVAFSLILSGHYYWGFVVVLIDYLPSWDLLVYNCLSTKWKEIIIAS